MKTVIAGLVVAGILISGFGAINTGVAEAADTRARTPCWWSYGGDWGLNWKVKPRICAFNGDEPHAFQTPLMKMRWRSWGGPTACGRGVFFYNQGYRAGVRFCLYGRILDGGVPIYTKIRGVFGRRWCADRAFGHGRVCGTREPTHFHNSTA